MSIVSAFKPASGSRLALLAWALVAIGAAGLVTALAAPVAGLVAGLATALVGLVVTALARASRTLGRILAEELDRTGP